LAQFFARGRGVISEHGLACERESGHGAGAEYSGTVILVRHAQQKSNRYAPAPDLSVKMGTDFPKAIGGPDASDFPFDGGALLESPWELPQNEAVDFTAVDMSPAQ